MPTREPGDQGQVFSSVAAVAAAVAILAGLVVLVATRGDDSSAAPEPSASVRTTAVAQPSRAVSAGVSPEASPGTSRSPEVSPEVSPGVSPTTTPTASSSVTIPAAELPAVEVFNNTRRKGLADEVAGRARAVGWEVAGADNWHGKVVTSTVYYPAGMRDAATQLAQVLGIGRVKEALPNMKKDRLSVILTSDYSG